MNKQDKQQRINRLLDKIALERSMHYRRIGLLQERINRLNRIARKLHDPHALIPKSYASIDEWLNNCGSFPNHIIGMIFENKISAIEVSYCCNTYQSDYHVVKCNEKEYYIEKYINKKP